MAPINILLGIALGPFFLELLKVNTAVIDLMELAVIFLLFSVGLRIHWQSFRQAIWPGIRIGLSSIFLSAILGGTAVYLLNNRTDEALYVAVALAATSVGIGAQVLEQYGYLSRKVGRILLAAAVVDDIIALYFLSVLHPGLEQKFDLTQILLTLAYNLLSLSALTLVLLWLARQAHQYLMSYGRLCSLSYHLLFLIAGSGITHLLGLSSVVGAFLAGVCLAIGCNNSTAHRRITNSFHQLAEWTSPIFFIGIGIQLVAIDIGSAHLLILVILIFMAAVAGKLFTPWFFQTDIKHRERWILGISLLPRGEVGLIVASTGYQLAHLDEHTMVALILMTILTALLPPFGVACLAKRKRSNTKG